MRHGHQELSGGKKRHFGNLPSDHPYQDFPCLRYLGWGRPLTLSPLSSPMLQRSAYTQKTKLFESWVLLNALLPSFTMCWNVMFLGRFRVGESPQPRIAGTASHPPETSAEPRVGACSHFNFMSLQLHLIGSTVSTPNKPLPCLEATLLPG